jgi:RsiW-degrading membrane proteinase PrsW (M82 family)
MLKIVALSFLITIIYSIIKFIEVKYFNEEENKQTKPLKLVIRDALITLISSLSCLVVFFYFEKEIMEFFNVVTENKNILINKKVDVFVDNPGF